MPASGFLALLDDIATILDDVAILTKVAAKKASMVADDVAVLSKVAAKKTAGVLGDDLALNAEQVTGRARGPRAAGRLGRLQGLARQQG